MAQQNNILANTNLIREIIDELQNRALPEGGSDTSDATATSNDIMLGLTAYIASGKTTGTFTIEEELSNLDLKVQEIQTALLNKTSGNNGDTLISVTNQSTTYNDLAYYLNHVGYLVPLEKGETVAALQGIVIFYGGKLLSVSGGDALYSKHELLQTLRFTSAGSFMLTEAEPE